ncbi:MAG TPA: hypothetical protein VFH82_14370 [Gemmatimonadota bacterium]|jgi:hypothetical protein|nr:hypothetical protein [Gemmatimonadota bacterium]
MRRATILRPAPIAALLTLALACSNGKEETGLAEQPIPYDSITAAEMKRFAVDPRRFPEMQGTAPLDSIDMTARSSADDAAWHVQWLNYAENHIAMTYAAWYTGPDSLVQFAADGQPYLLDDEGNRYEGVVTPDNPRIKVETDNTAVGVFAFGPGLSPGADSLTLYVNDSTEPVIRVGPWPVREDAARAPGPPPTR